MPYQSLSQAPSRLRVHKGAHLTLSQVNKWASIYDAVKRQESVDNPAAVAWGAFYKKFKKDGDRWVKREESVNESSIDYPSEQLPMDVWDKTDKGYVLKPEIEDKIRALFKKFDRDHGVKLLADSDEVHIIGSIGTNQYESDADVDVHILKDPDTLKLDVGGKSSDDWVREVIHWSWEPKNQIKVGDHPIELFLQLDESTDKLADAVYDFNSRTWIKGPQITPFSFDPYEVYAPVVEELRQIIKEADLAIGELERDVVDYDIIKGALSKLPDSIRDRVQERLRGKLEEIEKDIDVLAKDREEWQLMRRNASKSSPALSDIERVKTWATRNALFKFLHRYGYWKIIEELEKLKKGRILKDDDVPVIRSILRSR